MACWTEPAPKHRTSLRVGRRSERSESSHRSSLSLRLHKSEPAFWIRVFDRPRKYLARRFHGFLWSDHPCQLRASRFNPPSGSTSKWNPIEHRLFSQISKNWAGVPLRTYETMLNFIRTPRGYIG